MKTNITIRNQFARLPQTTKCSISHLDDIRFDNKVSKKMCNKNRTQLIHYIHEHRQIYVWQDGRLIPKKTYVFIIGTGTENKVQPM